MGAIGWQDYLVIALHFALTIGLGLWAARRANRGSSAGYFLAGRSMPWYLVGMSLYVSNIGSSSFLGIGGAASANGIAVICYELTGLFCIQLLGFLFVPVYFASGVYTMPEYVKKRFGGERLQIYLAINSLLLFAITKLAAEVYSGALIIQATLNWNIYLSVVLLLAITALYTIVGGLASVIVTDALQTVVIVIGGFILMILALIEVGGYEKMTEAYMNSATQATILSNTSCGLVPPNALHILRPISDANYPWTGVVFGAFILSTWYFCTDQVLVQRLLAAKNPLHAKGGSILAGYMKILPVFLMVWPGMIARVLYTEYLGCSTPEACTEMCGISNGCSNFAYVRLVTNLMPTGLRGLMLAAMLAALTSSLTSIFNSGSTIFTMDIWTKIRRKATQRELMIVSRLFTLVFIGLTIVWLPMVNNAEGGQLFNYLQSIASHINPPILTVYLAGILWSRGTEPGAFWTLLLGLLLGGARMIASWVYSAPACGDIDTRPWFIKDLHYLNFAIILFLFSCVVMWAVSMCTEPPTAKQLHRTTWWTRNNIIPPNEEDDDVTSQEEEKETKFNEPSDHSQESDEDNNKNSALEQENSTDPPTAMMRVWKWLTQPPQKEDGTVDGEDVMTNYKEADPSSWQATFVTFNLLGVVVAGMFIWGFFA